MLLSEVARYIGRHGTKRTAKAVLIARVFSRTARNSSRISACRSMVGSIDRGRGGHGRCIDTRGSHKEHLIFKGIALSGQPWLKTMGWPFPQWL
jgi:hypothetical protein